MQSNYLCVILHVKRKKVLIHTVFTWFLIFDKIQDSGQDGAHVWWRQRPSAAPPPIKYTSSCREDQRLSTEIKGFPKLFQNNATYQKPKGVLSTPPPPPPCTTVGVWLNVRPRVKGDSIAKWYNITNQTVLTDKNDTEINSRIVSIIIDCYTTVVSLTW